MLGGGQHSSRSEASGDLLGLVSLRRSPIPLDRTPFPLPAEATFSMFFTIQRGGAYLSTPGPIPGAWLVYPNVRHSRVGSRVQFFDYDADDKGWYPYGMGTSTTGRRRRRPARRPVTAVGMVAIR